MYCRAQGPAVPTLWRCAFGHGRENATLPLGAVCAVDTERGTLELATPQECAAMRAAVREDRARESGGTCGAK